MDMFKSLLGPKFGTRFRYFAALSSVMIIAWDYSRDENLLVSFSLWIVAMHFVYFQLPLKSRAIAYFHSLSYVGAHVLPIIYLYLYLTQSDQLDTEESMEQRQLTESMSKIRTIGIYFAPFCFHCLDSLCNHPYLLIQYRSKPRQFIFCWSLSSFVLLAVLYTIILISYYDLDPFLASSSSSTSSTSLGISSTSTLTSSSSFGQLFFQSVSSSLGSLLTSASSSTATGSSPTVPDDPVIAGEEVYYLPAFAQAEFLLLSSTPLGWLSWIIGLASLYITLLKHLLVWKELLPPSPSIINQPALSVAATSAVAADATIPSASSARLAATSPTSSTGYRLRSSSSASSSTSAVGMLLAVNAAASVAQEVRAATSNAPVVPVTRSHHNQLGQQQ